MIRVIFYNIKEQNLERKAQQTHLVCRPIHEVNRAICGFA